MRPASLTDTTWITQAELRYGRRTAQLDQPGLGRVQFQAELREPLAQAARRSVVADLAVGTPPIRIRFTR